MQYLKRATKFSLLYKWLNANRPVACKQWNVSEELIARDVTGGCSGCQQKCIAVNGNAAMMEFKTPTTHKLYRIFLFSEFNEKLEK